MKVLHCGQVFYIYKEKILHEEYVRFLVYSQNGRFLLGFDSLEQAMDFVKSR